MSQDCHLLFHSRVIFCEVTGSVLLLLFYSRAAPSFWKRCIFAVLLATWGDLKQGVLFPFFSRISLFFITFFKKISVLLHPPADKYQYDVREEL